jgi:hypothetical protein
VDDAEVGVDRNAREVLVRLQRHSEPNAIILFSTESDTSGIKLMCLLIVMSGQARCFELIRPVIFKVSCHVLKSYRISKR